MWRGNLKNAVFQSIQDWEIQPSPADCAKMSPEQLKQYVADAVAAKLEDEGFIHLGKDQLGVSPVLTTLPPINDSLFRIPPATTITLIMG